VRLYNDLFGVYPAADELLKMLGLERAAVPRFRDCYLSEDAKHIIVMTRTGGSYKLKWQEQNAELRRVFGFVLDAELSIDVTYITFHYLLPTAFKARAEELRASIPPRDPLKLWKQLTERMDSPNAADDPEVIRWMEIFRPAVERATFHAKAVGFGTLFDDDI
jgi:hypothetical protein